VQRRTVGVLIVGWLLGIASGMAVPDLVQERTSRVTSDSQAQDVLSGHLNAGYTLDRTQRVTDRTIVLEFRRPRYLAVMEQLDDGIDSLGNYAQRLRYGVMSSGCGSGRSASSVDVRTIPEPERNSGGNRYQVAWTLTNDCTAPVVVNRATITGFRSDGSVLFSVTTSKWQWIEPGYTWWHSDDPGYRGAEPPARVDVQLHYGYTR
jgi:hypothetical protein